MSFKDHLFLKALVKDVKELKVDIETYISLFTLICCENYNIKIYFVSDDEKSLGFLIPFEILKSFNYTFISEEHFQQIYCKLPAVKTSEEMIISGLCAVLRWSIKAFLKISPNRHIENLLGFRGGCLTACRESSVWTKFCEVELLEDLREILHSSTTDNFYVPEAVVKLEAHLKCPVRTHNISRRKVDILKKLKKKENIGNIERIVDSVEQNLKDLIIKDKVCEDLTESAFHLNHCYLEGIDLTLVDIIVLPVIHIILSKHFRSHLYSIPYTAKWYRRMFESSFIKKTATVFHWEELECNDFCDPVIIPENINDIRNGSLYSRDLSKGKPKCRNFDPSDVIESLKESNIIPMLKEMEFKPIEWENLPPELHPSNGDLPGKRIEKKCQQLQSIVKAVLKIASSNQTIVDFCSGGGHVGLLLAYYLPNCTIVLVENKEESLRRAKERATKLCLKNLKFFQCNLGYYEGSFDIGVALHACGSSTDLVINKCLKEKASFVCCPCCYGKIEDTLVMTYPRSLKFKSNGIMPQDFSMLAHCADRTEANTAKLEQGMYCMALIDTDRLLYANEHGYKVVLTTLQPITCSPKHNLLIGEVPISS